MGLMRHSLEPIQASELLQTQQDKYPYMQRQLLFDEIASHLRANLTNLPSTKQDFLTHYSALISHLETWKATCLSQFDSIRIQEDVQWALERLESQRFHRNNSSEYIFDKVLNCHRIDEVESLLKGVKFEFNTEAVFKVLPACFRVFSDLSTLRKPVNSHDLEELFIPLKSIQTAEIPQNFDKMITDLTETLKILMPFSEPNIEISLSDDMQIQAKSALAVSLTSKIRLEIDKFVTSSKTCMNEILQEMNSEMTSDESFLSFLERFKSVSIAAVANMNGISQALKSALPLTELTNLCDAANLKITELQEKLRISEQEIEELNTEMKAVFALKAENEELKSAGLVFREELRVLRLSLSAGLEESVKTIVESAKSRVGKSEEVVKSVIEETMKGVVTWEEGFRQRLEGEKTAVKALWTPIMGLNEPQTACEELITGNESVLESVSGVLKSVREGLAKDFRRYQEEAIALWDQHSKKYTAVMLSQQETMGKMTELPSFSMFLGTVGSEVMEQRRVLEVGSDEMEQFIGDLLVQKELIVSVVELLETRQVKKRDRAVTYARLKDILKQMEEMTRKLNTKKQEIWRNISSSLLSFEEASKDTNFQRLESLQDLISSKLTEFQVSTQPLINSSVSLRSGLDTAGTYFLKSIQSQFDSIPTALNEQKRLFSDWINNSISPIIASIMTSQEKCVNCIDSISTVISSDLQGNKQEIMRRKGRFEMECMQLNVQFPENIPVKPVMLSEAVKGLVDENEQLQEEVRSLNRALMDSEVALKGKNVKTAAKFVEKRVEKTIGALLAQWMGKASQAYQKVEVEVIGELQDLSMGSWTEMEEPVEVVQAIVREATAERQSTRLRALLPDHYHVIPIPPTQSWRRLETRLQALSLSSLSELTSSDLLFLDMQEADAQALVASWVLLARQGQPKAIFLLRLLGLETHPHITPHDFSIVIKHIRSFKILSEQYLKSTPKHWKKSQIYQLSRWGEAWLDDVLSKYVNVLSGDAWLGLLRYCKPSEVTDLEYVFFLVNWKIAGQYVRKEEAAVWPDPSVSVISSSDYTLFFRKYVDSWLPPPFISAIISHIGPQGYIEKHTVEGCLGLPAYRDVVKDHRFIVRGDMFLLGILDAMYKTSCGNCRKLMEIYEKNVNSEGELHREAFESVMETISPGEERKGEIYEEIEKEGTGLQGFLQVMLRQRRGLLLQQP